MGRGSAETKTDEPNNISAAAARCKNNKLSHPFQTIQTASPTRQPRRSMVGINLDPWSSSLCEGIAANQGRRESIPEPDGCNQMPAWILVKEPPAPPSAEDSARSAIFPLCRGADPGKQPKESIIEQNPPRVTLITGVAEIQGS